MPQLRPRGRIPVPATTRQLTTRRRSPVPGAVLAAILLLGAFAAQAQIPEPEVVPVGPCDQGRDLYRAGRFAEAREALLACLTAEGPRIGVLLPLVVMGVQEGRLPEALEYGAAAVELDPHDPEARYWYGRALLRAERTAEARAQWEAGLADRVDHLGLLEGLARLALAENETAKAYQLLSQMQRLGVHESWLERLMADLAAGKGLWAQSLGHLKEAMAQDGGGDPEDLLTASELSILAGDKQGAVAFCRQAVKLAPGATTYGGLGEAWFALEEVDSALVYLRLAVEQDPNNTRFRFNLANALEVSGQTEEADFHFQTFLQQQPNDPIGHFNYAIHLEKMGRTAEALLSVDRAIALDQGMLTARVVRVQLLEELGRWEDALTELADLRRRDTANTAQLNAWEARLIDERDMALGNTNEGKVHLQHMVLGTAELVSQVQSELARGVDFTALVVRYSSGSAAARGGDIGWVDPAGMVAPLGAGIAKLEINEISPPMESKGLYHIFKRIP